MAATELDKFTRFFVQKSIQVIIQSRLGHEKIKTTCNPSGNDWFNLAITDLKEVTGVINKCMDGLKCNGTDPKGFSVTKKWSICCEISLKNSDGDSMTLEYWILSNNPKIDEKMTRKPVQSSVASANASNSNNYIYDIYNRMSILLKSLISLTRATPAHKISSGQSPETFVICYRIFDSSETTMDKLISEKSKNHFSPHISLGSVVSHLNELNVSFVYRTEMNSCNENVIQTSEPKILPIHTDHFKDDDGASSRNEERRIPAFAPSPDDDLDQSVDLVPENAFLSMLIKKDETKQKKELKKTEPQKPGTPSSARKDVTRLGSLEKLEKDKVDGADQNTTSQLLQSSSEDSFVFVEAPFASGDQRVLGSFFNGPSPTFSGCKDFDLMGPEEISSEIEKLELVVPEWDSFVDSICSNPENEASCSE